MVTYHPLILHESSWMESFIHPPQVELDGIVHSSPTGRVGWNRSFIPHRSSWMKVGGLIMGEEISFKGREKGVRTNQPPTGEGPITSESTPPPNVPISYSLHLNMCRLGRFLIWAHNMIHHYEWPTSLEMFTGATYG
jgi:hypothetical protein